MCCTYTPYNVYALFVGGCYQADNYNVAGLILHEFHSKEEKNYSKLDSKVMSGIKITDDLIEVHISFTVHGGEPK